MIYKFLDPTSSQFVVVALVRAGMVYANKFLWESLIFKKLWAIAQEENWNKQKRNEEKKKLEQMQKSTSVQLDEKVEELVTKKMDSTVPKECETFWLVPSNMMLLNLVDFQKSTLKSHITMKPNVAVNMALKAEGGKTRNTATMLLHQQIHLQ